MHDPKSKPAMTDDVAGRWVMLGFVGLALILSMTTWFSATAILPELQARFHLSDAATSWLTNAVQIGFVVASLTFSITGLADALPIRGVMAVSALVAAASNIALLAVPGEASLFAARALTGMALAGVYPPALKLIATWFVKGRGLAMGAAVGALTLGSSAPYLVKAIGASVNWSLVVIVAFVAALVSAILFVVFVREGPHAVARPKLELGRIWSVLRDPALSLANLGYYGHMWELYAMWGWFLAFAGEAEAQHHALPVGPALLTFLVIAIGAAGCIVGGLLADRIGRTATTAAMMTISGLCALTIGFTFGSAWLFVTVALVWGFSVIADSAQFSAMATELSDAATTGAALALQVGIGFALTIVSIRLTPVAAGWIGWRWTFAMLAPGPFIGAIAMLTLRRRPEAVKIANGRR